MDMEERSDE